MNICVYGASSDEIDKNYILEGEALGEEIARRGHSLVFGGGTSGLMGAVARGADRFEGKIIGVAPLFFAADGVLYPNCTELIRTTGMRDRKEILEDLSDAFVITPGGIGTFDEFFEILTLKQLARHNKAITILNTDGYFDPIISTLSGLVDKGFMRDSSLGLYKVFDNSSALLDYIEGYIPESFDIDKMKHLGVAR